MTIKYKPGMNFNHLPSEESLRLKEVCLVQFSYARLDNLKQDTSSDPELSGLRETIYFGWPEKQKQVPAHLRKY